jgi:hypothetical protein
MNLVGDKKQSNGFSPGLDLRGPCPGLGRFMQDYDIVGKVRGLSTALLASDDGNFRSRSSGYFIGACSLPGTRNGSLHSAMKANDTFDLVFPFVGHDCPRIIPRLSFLFASLDYILALIECVTGVTNECDWRTTPRRSASP